MELSRNKRRKMWIGVKNDIHGSEYGHRGMFSSHHVIEGSWADIYFLSRKDNSIFYNATISSLRYCFRQRAEEEASKRLKMRVTEEEYKASYEMIFEKTQQGRATFGFKRLELPSLGGRTFPDVKRQVATMLEPLIEVRPDFRLLPDYRYGCGLDMNIVCDEITEDIVCEAIEQFCDLGEVNWVGDRTYTKLDFAQMYGD